MITGRMFFRDLKNQHGDKKLFLTVGQLWVPASILIKPEHKYVMVGSEVHIHEPELMTAISLQVLLNSEEDLTNEARKKHPSQIVPLLHTPQP